MRALADSADESLSYVGDGDWFPQDTMLQQTAAAIRAAADQLEAVQVWVGEHYHHFQEISELDAILTADTAPQEDRDD